MKRITCLLIAFLMLFAGACTDADVSDGGSSVAESANDASDASDAIGGDSSSPDVESSGCDETSDEISDETSDENSHDTSEQPLPFEYEWPIGNEWQPCDHGTVFYEGWFHNMGNRPFVEFVHPEQGETHESQLARGHGMVALTEEEYREWLNSPVPEEYKVEDHIHDTDYIVDIVEGMDPKPHMSKNILMFVRDFEVEREVFTEKIYMFNYYYRMYHDPEVVYEWDYQDAVEWYVDYNIKYRPILTAKYILENFRSWLWYSYEFTDSTKKLSCAQRIYELDLPREVVEQKLNELIRSAKKHYKDLYDGKVEINFKLDEVYNRSEEFMDLIEKANNGEIYPLQVEDWFIDIRWNIGL